MTLAEKYRTSYKYTNPESVMDWLVLLKEIDPKAKLSAKKLGVYVEFSDGSIWLLGTSERNAACMKV